VRVRLPSAQGTSSTTTAWQRRQSTRRIDIQQKDRKAPERNLSPKTIQKHVDNLWALGGEFIRDLHNDALRKKPVDRVLSKMIEYGGPLHYGSEDQQRSFDSTCRKFRRFLIEAAR
jgi:hypothetical protein